MARTLDFFDGFVSNSAPDVTGSTGVQELLGTGDGVTSNFNLVGTAINQSSVLVFANRVMHVGTEWTYNDILNRIEFVTPPAAGVDVYVWYLSSFAGGGGGGGGGVNQAVEYRTLTAGEISAKQLTLIGLPLNVTEVLVDAVGGSSQIYATDFTVVGSVLSWSGLGLDGELIEGDVLRIVYFV